MPREDDVHLVEFERRQVRNIMEEYNLTHYEQHGLVICNNCTSVIGPILTNHLGRCSKRPSRIEAHLLEKFLRSLKSPYVDPKEPLPHLPFKEVLVGLKCPYCTFYTKTWNVWLKHGNEIHGGLGEDNPVPCLIQCLYDIHAPSSIQVYYPVIPTDEAKALVKNYSENEMEQLLGSLNLRYDRENNVLLCTTCTTGVTKRLTNHLKNHGLYLSRHEYFLILFHCFTEESIYWKKHEEPIPVLPYLPVEDGLACNLCNYAAMTGSTMREHIREAHPGSDPFTFGECKIQRINKAHSFYRVIPQALQENNLVVQKEEEKPAVETSMLATDDSQADLQEHAETEVVEAIVHQHQRPIRPLNYP